ncbi:hypothetical protein [Actinomyces sp. MRS3W]|uniref:hypothetical protein n=1 Tax=Actinomyces sp. MRS3W TaxID=2800796 RepID=UPI0028FD70E2|nr:hypothetical protein [Actinomyces sp. MRS3W]MDU0347564.1 hypothetical protein [Actinomyces sp. MRS3W]
MSHRRRSPASARGARLADAARAGSRQGNAYRRRGQSRRRRSRRLGPVGVFVVSFLITLLVGLLVMNAIDTTPASSAPTGATEPAAISRDMTGFNAEHIIDDDVFYDSDTMTTAEITALIDSVNEGCRAGTDGTPCLADATFDTEDRDPTTACPGGYTAATGETAAEVISKVAASCDINPRVLLVLLHKEQGLLTASGASLTARRYEAATGYACPDGQECDPDYAGFFRQVYGAASQFQTYRLDPTAYQVVAGTTAQLAYSPNALCGTGEVTASNQATAGLYNYTPYLANAAAATGGDDCTSWGNWNFYGYYRTLFGDPAPSTAD